LLGAGTVGSVVDQPKVLGSDPGPSELLVVGVEPEQRGAETTSILQSVVVKLSGPGRDHRPGEQVVIDMERRFPGHWGASHTRDQVNFGLVSTFHEWSLFRAVHVIAVPHEIPHFFIKFRNATTVTIHDDVHTLGDTPHRQIRIRYKMPVMGCLY
jgi:hypothetical protein